MGLKLTFPLIISFLTGFLIITVLFGGKKSSPLSLFIKIVLSIGLGFGVSSTIFFISLLLHARSVAYLFIIEMVLLLTLSAIIYYAKVTERYNLPIIMNSLRYRDRRLEVVLLLIFLFAFVLSSLDFTFISLKIIPHGGWDAWAIWNLRARFLFRGGDRWVEGFNQLINWSHPDYPLLIPGLIARCWKYIGFDTVAIPIIVSMFFTFIVVGLIVSSLSILRSNGQGLLAGIVLLSNPNFIINGTYQCADIPLGFFFLATIILTFLQRKYSAKDYRLVVLAGMMAGFAAWTKNEGILFIILFIISGFIVYFPKEGWRAYLQEMLYFTIGLAPILMVIIYFKIQIAPPNDLIASQGFYPTLVRLLDPQRYIQTFEAFVPNLLQLGGMSYKISLLLLIYCLFIGFDIEKGYKLDFYESSHCIEPNVDRLFFCIYNYS